MNHLCIEKMIRSFCGYSENIVSKECIGNTRSSVDEVDIIIFNEVHTFDEDEFNILTPVFLGYIKQEEVEVKKWFEAIERLRHLIKDGYLIDEIGIMSKENVEELAASKKFLRDSRPSSSFQLVSEDLISLFEIYKSKFKEKEILDYIDFIKADTTQGIFRGEEHFYLLRENWINVLDLISTEIWSKFANDWNNHIINDFFDWLQGRITQIKRDENFNDVRESVLLPIIQTFECEIQKTGSQFKIASLNAALRKVKIELTDK